MELERLPTYHSRTNGRETNLIQRSEKERQFRPRNRSAVESAPCGDSQALEGSDQGVD